MKANKKIVFVAAYVVCALVAYTLFTKYNLSKYNEEYAILEAEFVAEHPSLKGYGPEYFFFGSVWGRNVQLAGLALLFGGLIGSFVLTTISEVRKDRRAR